MVENYYIVAGAGLRLGMTRPEHVQFASVAEQALVAALAEMTPALVAAVAELALVAAVAVMALVVCCSG